jgi:2-furoyl-CoA dehydrogenase large subunit
MSTPVCIANAVADAFGVAEIRLPLMPDHMLELLKRGSRDPTHRVSRL